MTQAPIAERPKTAFRAPRAEDGPVVWKMIERSGRLDGNSLYCNLLQCSHFSRTCVLAEMGDEPAGWMSAYLPPAQPGTLFVWQICTTPKARGQGLARRMILDALARPECRGVRRIECTITAGNAASWALFQSVARALDAPLASAPHFNRDIHLDGRHDSELRVTVGPFHFGGYQ